MKWKLGKWSVLLYLMAAMLIFTVISRIAASLTVAQVTVESPTNKKIEHTVSAEGSVKENLELAVLTEPELLVKTVYVTTGQSVKEGDVIAEIDMTHLAEQIQAKEEEIEILELTNADIYAGKAREQQSAERALGRAQEDYDQAVQEADAAVARAKETLTNAVNAYYSHLQSAQGADAEAQSVSLLEAAQAAQQAYDAAVTQQQNAVQNAARAVEDASDPIATESQSKINEIRIGQMERELQQLKELQQANGQIVAPVDGIVTDVFLATGQKTADTAAAKLADLTSGMRYVAEVTKDDMKYVAVGANLTLEKNGMKIEGCTVTSVETAEDGSGEVTVLIDKEQGKNIGIGDNLNMTLRKSSASSQIAVPLTAIHEENGRYYVYTLEEKGTVLGTEYYAMRVDVSVKDKNSSYAAIEDGVLTKESKVIVDSDRYIEAGSKVRLRET